MNKDEKKDAAMKLVKATVEYMASAQDSMLQEFLKANEGDDLSAITYASVVLWQLNVSMAATFKNLTSAGLLAGYGEKGRAQLLANNMAGKYKARMELIAGSFDDEGGLVPSAENGLPPVPDRSLN